MLAHRHPEHLVVEPGRIGRGAHVDRHLLVLVGRGDDAVGAGGLPLQVDDQGVALGHAAFDRLEPRGAFAQPLERGLHGVVVDRHRRRVAAGSR